MRGVTLSHRQKRCITSKPASSKDKLGAHSPLISKKLTRPGGDKDWIT